MSRQEKNALKYLAIHLLYGTVAGFTFGIALLITDLSNIRTLALESGHPVLVLGLLFFGLFVTFGSVGLGAGIMSLANDDGDSRKF